MFEKKMVKKLFFSEIVNQNAVVNEKEPIYNLILNCEEIEKIKDFKKNKKIFYFCKKKIHQILYDEDVSIDFNKEEESDIKNNLINNISEFFYLSLLVSYNLTQIDYKYDIKYIRIMYEYLTEDNDVKDLKKLILSKIIYSLITNYIQYNENEEFDNEIDTMKKNIEDIISKLKIEYSYNIFCEDKIDIMYLQIINSLIENKQFDKFEYCYDIIKQLDLENIDITSTIFEGLKETLNNKKDNYMKYYSIDNIEDLSNKTKINFYYILIVYILKNTIYIYNIDFLYKNIRKIKKLLIANNLTIKNEKLKSIINNLFPNIELSVIKIHDDNYVFVNKAASSFISDTSSINNEVSNMSCNDYARSISGICLKEREKKSEFSSYFNESIFNNSNINKSDNKLNENISLKNKGIAPKALIELNFQIDIEFHDLDKEKIRVFFENMTCGRKKKEIYLEDLKDEFNYYKSKYENEEELDEETKEYKIYKNFKKLIFFLKEIYNYIKISKIKINCMVNIELKRESNIERKNKEDKNIYNLSCIYKFKNEKNEYYFKDDDILVNNLDSKKHGFLFLINELTNSDYD